MSDQQSEDQGPEPMRAEIVGSFQEYASETPTSNYMAWLDATNECAGIRHEAWEQQIEYTANILFGVMPNGETEDREPWKESDEDPVTLAREKVRLAAGAKLIRLLGENYDPAYPIAYDPPAYFAAVSQSDEETCEQD